MQFSWFSVFKSCANYHHSYFQNISSTPKENLYLFIVILHSSFTSPWQALIDFLSLWICLCWTFHINGITQVCPLYLDVFTWHTENIKFYNLKNASQINWVAVSRFKRFRERSKEGGWDQSSDLANIQYL